VKNSATWVGIEGDSFTIDGESTYPGRVFRGMPIEGLLMNARLVQGIFDDLNPETRRNWDYPDGPWDPERNTDEFVQAMPAWRAAGLLSFTICLQGGNPRGYGRDQPWHNSAFTADGELREAYIARLSRILNRADELGMVPIVGYFYFGQDGRLRDEASVVRAVENATDWILERGYRNVLIEIGNEVDNRKYDHAILKAGPGAVAGQGTDPRRASAGQRQHVRQPNSARQRCRRLGLFAHSRQRRGRTGAHSPDGARMPGSGQLSGSTDRVQRG